MAETRAFDRVPGDAGLSGLGLVMQATGLMTFWFAVYALAILALLPGKTKGVALLVALISAARSGVHYRAGKRVAAGRPTGVHLYVGVAAIHTIAVAALVAMNAEGAFKTIAPYLGLLLLWPGIAFALTRREAVRSRLRPDGTVLASDRGVLGLATLMTAFGIIGCAFALMMIGNLVFGPKIGVAAVIGGLILFVFLTRGFMHARAGISMLRMFDPHRFQEDRDRYYVFGAISTGLVMVFTLFAMFSGGLMVALVAVPVGGVLMAWPAICRNFGAVHIEDWAEADLDLPALGMPADGGLTTLGVLLLGYGGLTLGFMVLSLSGGDTALALPGVGPLMPGMNTWRGIAIAATTVWVGLELITMSDRVKLATTVNVVVLCSLSLWQGYESWGVMGGALRGFAQRPTMMIMLLSQVAIPLVIPVLAAIQARRLPPESALRRYEDVF